MNDTDTKITTEIYNKLASYNTTKNLNELLDNQKKGTYIRKFSDGSEELVKGTYEYLYESRLDDLYFIEHPMKGDENPLKEISEIEKKSVKSIFLKSIDISKDYYSSYLKITKDQFMEKNLIWISPKLDQALIHIFDINRKLPINDEPIHPSIFKFKINKSINLIESKNLNNEGIFKNILEDSLISEIEGILRSNSIPNFQGEKNKYILLILIELNKFLSPENQIYGYMNYFDQNEIGLINFNDLVDRDSVKESKYLSITVHSKIVDQKIINHDSPITFVFPLAKDDFNLLVKQTQYVTSGNAEYFAKERGEKFTVRESMWRMIMQDRRNKIEYQNFDDISKVESWNPSELEKFFELKYLKYKQKYLQLKKKLNS